MADLSLEIHGMSCSHCLNAVRKALDVLPGVQVREVRIGSAKLAYDPAAQSPDAIAKAVTDAGYVAAPLGGAA